MPTITVEGPVISDMDKKRDLVRICTEAASAAYGIAPPHIVVVIKANSPDNVAVGGVLLSDRKGAGGKSDG